MSPAKALIEALRLVPHPEGGWYRETWRAPPPEAAGEHGRAAATAILFLLEAHQRSHWHKVDAAELWLWHAGDPLLLEISSHDRGPVGDIRIGPDVLGGDHPQYLIQPGEWQAAAPLPGQASYSLVSCVVTPGFEFAGFTLAPDGWRPGSDVHDGA